MDKPVINEKLIASYEIDFGKGKTVVNEYSPSLTKDEIELNRMTVLIIHGIEDKLVKIEYSRKANERYENCELIEVHGDHGFILKGFKAGKKATAKYLKDLD